MLTHYTTWRYFFKGLKIAQLRIKTPGVLNKNNDFLAAHESFWNSLDRNKRIVMDFENVTKSGRKVFVETTIDPLYNEGGELDGFLEIQRLSSPT